MIDERYLSDQEIEDFERDLSKPNNVSIKDAINYAIDVIYKLNDELKTPYENPFESLQDLEKELFLRKFQE